MLGLIGSFNPNFYREITKQSLWRSLGFLIVFITIISAIVSYKYTLIVKNMLPQVNSWTQKNLVNIASDFPTIEIEDGSLTLPKDVYIKEWADGFVFVVQPEAENVYPILERYSNVLLLTREKFITKTTKEDFEQSEIKTYNLKKIKFFKITPTNSGLKVFFNNRAVDITPPVVRKLLEKLSLFIYPLLFLFFFSIYGFTKPLQTLIFSLLSLIFNTNLKATLSYRQLLNIGVYALVPSTSLAMVGELSNLKIPLFWVIYLLIYFIYIFLGIKSTTKESR